MCIRSKANGNPWPVVGHSFSFFSDRITQKKGNWDEPDVSIVHRIIRWSSEATVSPSLKNHRSFGDPYRATWRHVQRFHAMDGIAVHLFHGCSSFSITIAASIGWVDANANRLNVRQSGWMCHFAAQSYAIHQVKRSVDQRLAEMNNHKSASCTATRTSKEKIHISFIMIRLYHRDWIVENGFIGSHGIKRSNETESVWKGWS